MRKAIRREQVCREILQEMEGYRVYLCRKYVDRNPNYCLGDREDFLHELALKTIELSSNLPLVRQPYFEGYLKRAINNRVKDLLRGSFRVPYVLCDDEMSAFHGRDGWERVNLREELDFFKSYLSPKARLVMEYNMWLGRDWVRRNNTSLGLSVEEVREAQLEIKEQAQRVYHLKESKKGRNRVMKSVKESKCFGLWFDGTEEECKSCDAGAECKRLMEEKLKQAGKTAGKETAAMSKDKNKKAAEVEDDIPEEEPTAEAEPEVEAPKGKAKAKKVEVEEDPIPDDEPAQEEKPKKVVAKKAAAKKVEVEEEPEPEEPEKEPEPEEEPEPEGDGLDDMDRSALKGILKSESIEFIVYKTTSDDEIRAAIRQARVEASKPKAKAAAKKEKKASNGLSNFPTDEEKAKAKKIATSKNNPFQLGSGLWHAYEMFYAGSTVEAVKKELVKRRKEGYTHAGDPEKPADTMFNEFYTAKHGLRKIEKNGKIYVRRG